MKAIILLRDLRETDRLGGIDPYSASKASAELISRAYKKVFLKTVKKDVEFPLEEQEIQEEVIGH